MGTNCWLVVCPGSFTPTTGVWWFGVLPWVSAYSDGASRLSCLSSSRLYFWASSCQKGIALLNTRCGGERTGMNHWTVGSCPSLDINNEGYKYLPDVTPMNIPSALGQQKMKSEAFKSWFSHSRNQDAGPTRSVAGKYILHWHSLQASMLLFNNHRFIYTLFITWACKLSIAV